MSDTKTIAAGLRGITSVLATGPGSKLLAEAADRLEELERELSAITGEEGQLWELRQKNESLRHAAENLSKQHAKEAQAWASMHETERALADRLAKGCDALLTGYNTSSWDSPMEKGDVEDCEQALAAWKQARGKEA